jgi:hypothetical protein
MEKLTAYRKYQKDPQLAAFQMLFDMQQSLPKLVEEAVKNIVGDKKQFIADAVAEVRQVKKGEPGPKGDIGPAPVKFKDYFTTAEIREVVSYIQSRIPKPKDGQPGHTPKAGIDYPNEKQLTALVRSELDAFYARTGREKLTRKDVEQIAKSVMEPFDPATRAEDIARALEALNGAARLDYNALKNRPGIPAYSTTGGAIHRGGPVTVQYYDVSSSCDGSTKTFTIPGNTRVLAVLGTEFPLIYRPVIDWSGSGTTTLTLSSEVSAPQTGQTLFIHSVA